MGMMRSKKLWVRMGAMILSVLLAVPAPAAFASARQMEGKSAAESIAEEREEKAESANSMGEGVRDEDGFHIDENGVLISYSGNAIEVMVPEGVTAIGEYAFIGCEDIVSVSFPESVEAIGESAFSSCRSLSGMILPNGISFIGRHAFSGCKSLASIRLPSGLLSIEEYTFSDCSSLESIFLPEGMTDIGNNAFSSCANLANVILPESLVSIGNGAFSGCSSLTGIDIPKDVTSIGELAFFSCSSLEDIRVAEKNSEYSSDGGILYDVNKNVLLKCPEGKAGEITLPEEVQHIGANAFKGCSGLTAIRLPEELETIGEMAFEGCASLNGIHLPEKVEFIGSHAFGRCSSLESIAVAEGNYSYLSLDGVLYNKDKSILLSCPGGKTGEVAIPEGVSVIEEDAFEECGNLANIIIPEGVETIKNYAFFRCGSLMSISLPKSLRSIGIYVFDGCSNLQDIHVAEEHSMLSSSEGILYNKSKSILIRCPEGKAGELTVPEEVASIREGAFRDCCNLLAVRLPDGMSKIEDYTFAGCKSLADVKLPEGLQSMGIRAFKDCSCLEEIRIPEGVPSIGIETFNGCSSLKYINIPEGIRYMGSGAFSGCSSLKKIGLPEGLTSIGEEVFYNCSGLARVSIPEEVSSIGVRAFSGCSSLVSVRMPEGVTRIGGEAFSGCSRLTNIEIPKKTASIGRNAFLGCSSLASVIFPENGDPIAIEGYAFSGCGSLKSINLSQSVKFVGYGAFSGCGSLEKIDVAKGSAYYSSDGGILYNEDKSLLLRCPEGKTGVVIVPEGVISVGDSAFHGCRSLVGVSLPEGMASVRWGAFRACSDLKGIEIPESVASIGSKAFENCSSLTIYGIEGSYAQQYAQEHGIPFSYPDSSKTTPLSSCNITLSQEAFICDGTPKIPEVTVADGGKILELGKDYILICQNNIEVGTAEAILIGRGDYSGKVIKVFAIVESEGAGDYEYTAESDGITIIKYTGSGGKVIIPSRINGMEVTAIDGYTYAEGDDGDEWIVRKGAFEGRTDITEISIPNTVKRIGKSAFEDCSSLENISMPDSVNQIGGNVFKDCCSLKSIKIPDSVTEIGDYAFWGCTNLESISVESGNAFYDSRNNCNAIIETESHTLVAGCKSTEIPPDVVSIGKGAFYKSGLTDIMIPSGVAEIGYSAFSDCSHLKSVKLSDQLTGLGSEAFSNCVSLTDIELPESLSWIGDYAFEGCVSLSGIKLPQGLDSIESYVFSGCSGLVDIKLPEHLNVIGDFAFSGCSSLLSIELPGRLARIEMGAFSGCGNLESIVLPESLEYIGRYAFTGCSTLAIYGNEGSYAEDYAKENAIPFRLLSLFGKVAAITLTPSEAVLKPGDMLLLEAAVAPADAENKQLKWSSSDMQVATVKDGLVTAVSEGSAAITAESQDGSEVSASCKIEVKNNAQEKEYTITASGGAGGKIDPEGTVTVAEGESKTFAIMADDGYTIRDVKVDGISVGAVSSYTMADITANHTIAAEFGRLGQVIIEKITLSQTEASLEIGKTLLLETEITPENAGEKQLKWSSSNAQVASVENGLVTAISEGSATITAESQDGSNVFASCKVRVQKAGSGQKEKEDQSFTGTPFYSKTYGDAPFKLDAVLAEGNGSLAYASSNLKVVEVSEKGEVKITGAGKASITVTASETEEYKKCEFQVSVNVAKASQRISGTAKYSKTVGSKPFRLDAKRTVGEGKISYLSADRNVATVSDSGIVTIKKPGNTVITVTVVETPNYNAYTFRIKLSVTAPKKGTTLTDPKTKAKYKVTKQGKSVEYSKPNDKKATKAVIPATVTISGVKYNVTGIAANAFSGCKKLKSASIGKNVESIGTKAFANCTALGKISIPSKVSKIGKQAFFGCGKLKGITISSTKLTSKSVGAKAFQGIYAKATVKVPKAKKVAYQKLLKSKGIGKKVKIK